MGFFDSTKKINTTGRSNKLKHKCFNKTGACEILSPSKENNPSNNFDFLPSLLNDIDNNKQSSDPDFLSGLQCWSSGDRKSAIFHFGQSMGNDNPYGALGLAAVSEEIFYLITQNEPYHIGSSKEVDATLTAIISSSFFVWGTDQKLAEDTDVMGRLQRVANACSSQVQFFELCEKFQSQILDDLDIDNFVF